jgi:hypothetical protein
MRIGPGGLEPPDLPPVPKRQEKPEKNDEKAAAEPAE